MSSFTPGPWEYIASNEHHGPYVACNFGGDICDCYAMSNPSSLSVRNGGDSKPIHSQHEMADANAHLIAAAPDLLEALKDIVGMSSAFASATSGQPFTHQAACYVIDKARVAIAKAEGREVKS